MLNLEMSLPFLRWLAGWEGALKAVPLLQTVPDPARTAILSVDLIVGFAYEGTLANPRVAGILPAVVELMYKAHAAGVKRFVLLQDCHPPDTPEFASFGAHCVCGTREAETVPELRALPFSDRLVVMPKNSLSSSIGTALEAWLNAHHQELDTFIVVGDCTDLCVYELAMYLRLRANAHGYRQRVIVPANCVQTYDLSVDVAQKLGIMPHDGDFLHVLFLYQMALNGIEVVRELC